MKQKPPGAVDISDIVSRIAPKVSSVYILTLLRVYNGFTDRDSALKHCIHSLLVVPLKYGRPTVAEPTLQQWIGDSAAIPCTPDVQVPRPKKKSPR